MEGQWKEGGNNVFVYVCIEMWVSVVCLLLLLFWPPPCLFTHAHTLLDINNKKSKKKQARLALSFLSRSVLRSYVMARQ